MSKIIEDTDSCVFTMVLMFVLFFVFLYCMQSRFTAAINTGLISAGANMRVWGSSLSHTGS